MCEPRPTLSSAPQLHSPRAHEPNRTNSSLDADKRPCCWVRTPWAPHLTPRPHREENFPLFAQCCTALLLLYCVWTPLLGKLFPFVALRHADVTLLLTRPVWTRGEIWTSAERCRQHTGALDEFWRLYIFEYFSVCWRGKRIFVFWRRAYMLRGLKAGPHRARRSAAPRFCYSTKQGEKRIWCGHNIRIYQCKPIALSRREHKRVRCGPALRQVRLVQRIVDRTCLLNLKIKLIKLQESWGLFWFFFFFFFVACFGRAFYLFIFSLSCKVLFIR